MVTSLPPPTCLHRRLVRQAPKLDGQVALILLVLTLGRWINPFGYHMVRSKLSKFTWDLVLLSKKTKNKSSCAWGFWEFWECRCQYECRIHSVVVCWIRPEAKTLWGSRQKECGEPINVAQKRDRMVLITRWSSVMDEQIWKKWVLHGFGWFYQA